MSERPWCCPDHSCEPVHQALNEPQPELSFICLGRLPERSVVTVAHRRHPNDLRSCHYSPTKGVIAWQENEQDWRLLAAAYTDGLAALGD